MHGQHIATCLHCGKQWVVGDCIPSICPDCERAGHSGLLDCPVCNPRRKRSVGLYRKFDVSRTDRSGGPGGKHEGCEYFVLDLTHDPHARRAAFAYADSCEIDGFRVLAAQLRRKVVSLNAPAKAVELLPDLPLAGGSAGEDERQDAGEDPEHGPDY